jgi:apolipoprotein N-acyltransferase
MLRSRVTALLIAYLALYHGCAGVLISLLLPSPSGTLANTGRRISPWCMAAIPCVWVAAEYCRGFLLTGFPWALAGYSQYLNLPAIQISDITGVWGVSFAVVMVNVCVYLLYRSWNEGRFPMGERNSRSRGRRPVKIAAPAYLLCSTIALACALVYGYHKLSEYPGLSGGPSEGALKVAVVQGNIPQAVKWDPSAQGFILRKYFSMSVSASAGSPDVIVWPEASLPTVLVSGDPGYMQVFERWYDEHPVPILLGAVTAKGDS